MSKPALNLRKIRALAGKVWFARGEAYFQQGRVGELNELNGKLSTIVTGTEDYRVRLWTEDNDLGYTCTCPLGDDEQFCKHCVAAALAWLAPAQNERSQRTHEPGESDLRAFLEQQEKEDLIAMLLREAENNRGARERLQLEAARKKPSGVDLRAFRRSIANATSPPIRNCTLTHRCTTNFSLSLTTKKFSLTTRKAPLLQKQPPHP